jgi:hypothetical protein
MATQLLPRLGAPPVAGQRVQAGGGSGHARLRGADKPEDVDYTVKGYARHLDGNSVRRAHLMVHGFGGP